MWEKHEALIVFVIVVLFVFFGTIIYGEDEEFVNPMHVLYAWFFSVD